MTTLPATWSRASVGEVASVVRGVTYDKKDSGKTAFEGSLPVLRATNISEAGLVLGDYVYVPKGCVAPDQRLRKGDILLATSSGSLAVVGRAVFISEDMNAGFGAFCGVVRAGARVFPRYLAYYFQTRIYRQTVSRLAAGTNINNLKRGDLIGLELPLPPLPEQVAIAAKMDELFSDIDAGVRSIEEVGRLLPATHASLLDAAFSGLLSGEELDSASGLPCGWRWTTLGDESLTEIEAGLTKNPRRDNLPSRLPYLRVANVYKNELRLDEMKTIGVTEAEARQKALRAGDLLVVEGNGSRDQIGRVALWDGSIAPVVHQNHIIRVRFGDSVNPYFALYWLMSARGRSAVVERASTTSGLYTLSKSKVASLPLPMTDRATQDRIVAVVDAELSRLAAAGRYVTDAGRRSEALRQSVLSAAFSGQLI